MFRIVKRKKNHNVIVTSFDVVENDSPYTFNLIFDARFNGEIRFDLSCFVSEM